ncbi:Kinase-like protein [Mycena venus]|uniref:Kinase-like protein n=1 Tax=Mycena venus TaxID=2733690 RepID=A0A8H6XQN0_9AGAR|nr:Kinase-like protein [Mycena venus]
MPAHDYRRLRLYNENAWQRLTGNASKRRSAPLVAARLAHQNSNHLHTVFQLHFCTSVLHLDDRAVKALLAKLCATVSRNGRGWVSDVVALGKDPWACEDAIPALGFDVLDATRISDGAQVVLKVVRTESTEATLATRLANEPGADKYTIPVLELLPFDDDPGRLFLVMPRMRQCSHPLFATVREFTEFVLQVLEALVFLHSKNIAHRDICTANIVMDASRIIPGGFHFLSPLTSDGVTHLREYSGDDSEPHTIKSRTEAGLPTKYYFIDFGLAVRFLGFQKRRLVTGDVGRLRKRVPEISATVPYDPFKVDVRLVGEMLRSSFLLNYTGLDFVVPFVRKLRRDDPDRRPDAAQALAMFQRVVCKMNERELERPLEECFWDKQRRAVLFLKGLGRH